MRSQAGVVTHICLLVLRMLSLSLSLSLSPVCVCVCVSEFFFFFLISEKKRVSEYFHKHNNTKTNVLLFVPNACTIVVHAIYYLALWWSSWTICVI